jgi:hypothetical protein
VEFYGALGKVETGCDLFIGKAAENAVQNLFLTACKLNGTFRGMSGLQEFFGAFIYATDQMRIGLNHDDVIAGRLATDHAVHGEKAGGLVNGKVAIGTSFEMKMSGAGIFFVEDVKVARSGRVLMRKM